MKKTLKSINSRLLKIGYRAEINKKKHFILRKYYPQDSINIIYGSKGWVIEESYTCKKLFLERINTLVVDNL